MYEKRHEIRSVSYLHDGNVFYMTS